MQQHKKRPKVQRTPLASDKQAQTGRGVLLSTHSIAYSGRLSKSTSHHTTEDAATAAALAFAEIFFCMADLAKEFDRDAYLTLRRAGLNMQGDVLTGGGR
jgi:hypothetical protein